MLAVIREQLVRSGYLKGIIGLPANLFYGTGMPACILVLDKENAIARKGIFMIDASRAYKRMAIRIGCVSATCTRLSMSLLTLRPPWLLTPRPV